MVLLLNELKQTAGTNKESKAFRELTADLHDLTSRLDDLLEKSTRRDVQWFLKVATTLMR